MISEHRPGTPAYCDEKWSPLTEGLEGRESVYTAWAMEKEARYLTSQRDHEESISGVSLRFVFPALRRAVPQLLDGELNFQRVYKELEGAIYECYMETVPDSDYEVAEYVPTIIETTKLTLGLAERAKASIEGLRDIL